MRVSLEQKEIDVEGVWVEYRDGVRFRVARAGNPRFLKATDRAESPHRKAIARGKLGTEAQINIQCKAMAEGILLDWEGLATEDGNDLPYTKEDAAKVLRYNVEVRDFVFDFATEQENFRTEQIEEVGNESPDFSLG